MEEDGFTRDLRRFAQEAEHRPTAHMVREAVRDLVRAWLHVRNYANDELKREGADVVVEGRIGVVAERVWQDLTDQRYAELVVTSCTRQVRRLWGEGAAVELAALMHHFYEVRDAALALTSPSEADRAREIALVAGRSDELEKCMRAIWKRLGDALDVRPNGSDR